MSDYHGLLLLAERLTVEFDRTKKSLSFATKWIDAKHRDGGRITAREYQEVLNELRKIEKGCKAVKEPKEILLICACGEVMRVDDLVDISVLVCRACPRHGEFKKLCEDCKGTEQLGGQRCHCVHD